MKRALIVIFLIIYLLIPNYISNAMLLPKSILELYVESDLVIIGKIADLNEMVQERKTLYIIEVERYLKNPQAAKIIIAIGKGAKSSELRTSIDKIFEKGDRVLLYLNVKSENYTISPYSFNVGSLDIESKFIPSPLKLWQAGIDTKEIVCKGDLVLVTKAVNNSPACIKPTSVQRILNIGWARS